MQVRMTLRVLGDLKKRFEYVVQQRLERETAARSGRFSRERFCDLPKYSGDLHHPLHSFRCQIVSDDPGSQNIPFRFASPIYTESRFEIHVIVGTHVTADNLSGDICEKTAIHNVVMLQKNFAQALHSKWFVLLVKLVEALPHSSVRAVAYSQRLQAEVARLEQICLRHEVARRQGLVCNNITLIPASWKTCEMV